MHVVCRRNNIYTPPNIISLARTHTYTHTHATTLHYTTHNTKIPFAKRAPKGRACCSWAGTEEVAFGQHCPARETRRLLGKRPQKEVLRELKALSERGVCVLCLCVHFKINMRVYIPVRTWLWWVFDCMRMFICGVYICLCACVSCTRMCGVFWMVQVFLFTSIIFLC